MKKEVVLAIVLGIIFGLVITFGIYTANKALRDRQQNSTENAQDEQTTDTATQVTQIIAPEDGAIIAQDTVRLTGTTFPNADVIILVGEDSYATTSDGTGNFSAELELIGGSNVITTVITNPEGRQERDERIVVYSTADLDEIASASARPSLTPTPSPSVTQ